MSGEPDLPAVVRVGAQEYTLRPFQGSAGHDWLRGERPHRGANGEINTLVDEIVRLRAIIATAEQEQI